MEQLFSSNGINLVNKIQSNESIFLRSSDGGEGKRKITKEGTYELSKHIRQYNEKLGLYESNHGFFIKELVGKNEDELFLESKDILGKISNLLGIRIEGKGIINFDESNVLIGKSITKIELNKKSLAENLSS